MGSARVEQGWRGRLQAAAAPSAACTLCLFVCTSGCDRGIGLARARAWAHEGSQFPSMTWSCGDAGQGFHSPAVLALRRAQ